MREIGEVLKDAIPANIDKILTVRRDEGKLRVLSNMEIYNLGRVESVDEVIAQAKEGEIEDWFIIRLDLLNLNRDITFMIGYRDGHVFNTSGVVAIDPEAGVVRTQNSVYRVGDRGVGEPDELLRLHVCHYLHTCGAAGRLFGVLNVFY